MPATSHPSHFGRINESERIQRVINAWMAAPKEINWFGILGISGYGGVGKSYLLKSVLNEQKLETRDVFPVMLDGSNKPLLSDFIAMVDEKLASRTVSFKGVRAGEDQFPETRKLLCAQRKLSAKVDKELEKQGAGKEDSDRIVRTAKALYRFRPLVSKIPTAGPFLSTVLEKSEEYKLEEYAQPAADLLKGLKALNPVSRWPFKKLRMSPLELLSVKPMETITAAYEADVRARLKGYEGKNILKLMHGRSKDVNRLLLVIDDYESTGGVLGDLLVDHLLQAFAKAPYPVLVIIVGRDDIRDVDPEFSKSLASFVKDRIQLEPFSREEAILFLENAGYSHEEASTLFDESNGYPFVLSLLGDFKSNQGARPAMFYQQFFERITHWMTTQQKEWLLPLCYLDVVNHSSIGEMIPTAVPSTIMDWFRKEASVRDVKAPSFRVDPYIRRMLLQHHLNLIGSEQQMKLMTQARDVGSLETPSASH